MIVWSGWGLLTILIVAVVSLVVGAVLQLLLVAAGIPQLVGIAGGLGVIAAAAVNWIVGRRLNNKPGRELIDATTGQRVVLRRQHKLFWIRMEYWSYPVAAIGLVAILLGVASNTSRTATAPTNSASSR